MLEILHSTETIVIFLMKMWLFLCYGVRNVIYTMGDTNVSLWTEEGKEHIVDFVFSFYYLTWNSILKSLYYYHYLFFRWNRLRVKHYSTYSPCKANCWIPKLILKERTISLMLKLYLYLLIVLMFFLKLLRV